jgi:hypothetical protein
MADKYQKRLRKRFLAAPETPPPLPWKSVFGPPVSIPIGGLIGVGLVSGPGDAEFAMVVSFSGRGVFDARTGERLARDPDDDRALIVPSGLDLSCPGLGPLAGTRVRIAGLFGGGLHTTTEDR